MHTKSSLPSCLSHPIDRPINNDKSSGYDNQGVESNICYELDQRRVRGKGEMLYVVDSTDASYPDPRHIHALALRLAVADDDDDDVDEDGDQRHRVH